MIQTVFISHQNIGLTGNTNQFGYIYLQPFESDDTTFDDTNVVQALIVKKTLPRSAYSAYTWPASPSNTNFRMAVPDFNQPRQTNAGHSEYLLLKDDGLGDMLRTFQTKHGSCPEYVLLYSTLLPCMYPPNPVSPGQVPVPRCAEMTVNAKKSAKRMCPGSAFNLYTHEVTNKQYPDVFDKTVKYFTKNGITWINPNSQLRK